MDVQGRRLRLSHSDLISPLPRVRPRHPQRAAEVIGLPFHPVVLRGVADRVAVAGPARRGRTRRVLFGFSPQRRVKPDVAVFVSGGKSKPGVIARTAPPPQNLHLAITVPKIPRVSLPALALFLLN